MRALHATQPPIVHCDLKSHNVLLWSGKQRAKVADFGLAKPIQTSMATATGGGGGTLAWSAPETFDGKFSEKSDVFSFAVVVYEILTRKLPHEGKSPQEVTKLLFLTEADKPLAERRPDLTLPSIASSPRALVDLMKVAWSDVPAARPSFGQLLVGLEGMSRSKVPLSWMPSVSNTGIDCVNLPDGDEKKAVADAFLSTVSDSRISVLRVERIQNPILWLSYSAYLQSVRKRDQQILKTGTAAATAGDERRWLFHGTNHDTAEKIVAQGFNRSFCGKNATVYGKGVSRHFVTHPGCRLDIARGARCVRRCACRCWCTLCGVVSSTKP